MLAHFTWEGKHLDNLGNLSSWVEYFKVSSLDEIISKLEFCRLSFFGKYLRWNKDFSLKTDPIDR